MRLHGSEHYQLTFLDESKKVFYAKPLRFWFFYVLIGLAGLFAALTQNIAFGLILVLLNFAVFIGHVVYAKTIERKFFLKWNKITREKEQ